MLLYLTLFIFSFLVNNGVDSVHNVDEDSKAHACLKRSKYLVTEVPTLDKFYCLQIRWNRNGLEFQWNLIKRVIPLIVRRII